MLALRDVSAGYGSIHALSSVSLDVADGEIVCLIGANGAGKSTLLNVVSGVVAARSGTVTFRGTALRGSPASAIMRRGVVQVPEGRLVFPDMTVGENLEMGAFTRPAREYAPDLDFVFRLFPRLRERRAQLAGLMSGGEQQMLAIGRAMMARPHLLLLDEPSMGLAPLVIADIFRTLRQLRDTLGVTILLVEQNARAALGLADRAYVLTTGRISAGGPAQALLADGAILDAFLGRRRAHTASATRNQAG